MVCLTLRIKCYIYKISVHKISTNVVSLSAIVVYGYCLVTISMWMCYVKLDCNSATRTGPIPNTLFPILAQGVMAWFKILHGHVIS